MMIFTPAKINLGLKVLEKRRDGFHNLDSYIYPIPLYDIIELFQQEHDELIQTGINASVSMVNNLVYKALSLLREDHEIPPLKIHLHKQIPVQAGLGGGSGNAVGMLQLLNREFQLNIQESQMFEYAAQLGSDCPFFVKAQASRISSRGEEISSVDFNLKGRHIVVLKPALAISTAEAFASIHAKAELLPDISTLLEEDYQASLVNDFEGALAIKYPEIQEMKTWLMQQGAYMASLSGSGSAIYALFKEMPKLDCPFDVFIWQSEL